jgi:hypothetical protein
MTPLGLVPKKLVPIKFSAGRAADKGRDVDTDEPLAHRQFSKHIDALDDQSLSGRDIDGEIVILGGGASGVDLEAEAVLKRKRARIINAMGGDQVSDVYRNGIGRRVENHDWLSVVLRENGASGDAINQQQREQDWAWI